jgi:hypothetical protein
MSLANLLSMVNLSNLTTKGLYFMKCWLIILFPYEIDMSSFSSSWQRASLFFENSIIRVSLATFSMGVSLMYSSSSSSMVVRSAYIALPALIHHFYRVSTCFSTDRVIFSFILGSSTDSVMVPSLTSSDGVISDSPTTSHRS